MCSYYLRESLWHTCLNEAQLGLKGEIFLVQKPQVLLYRLLASMSLLMPWIVDNKDGSLHLLIEGASPPSAALHCTDEPKQLLRLHVGTCLFVFFAVSCDKKFFQHDQVVALDMTLCFTYISFVPSFHSNSLFDSLIDFCMTSATPFPLTQPQQYQPYCSI